MKAVWPDIYEVLTRSGVDITLEDITAVKGLINTMVTAPHPSASSHTEFGSNR